MQYIQDLFISLVLPQVCKKANVFFYKKANLTVSGSLNIMAINIYHNNLKKVNILLLLE